MLKLDLSQTNKNDFWLNYLIRSWSINDDGLLLDIGVGDERNGGKVVDSQFF
jgi:hypothetical protein